LRSVVRCAGFCVLLGIVACLSVFHRSVRLFLFKSVLLYLKQQSRQGEILNGSLFLPLRWNCLSALAPVPTLRIYLFFKKTLCRFVRIGVRVPNLTLQRYELFFNQQGFLRFFSKKTQLPILSHLDFCRKRVV
jgi:hypothetical protein